jgi:hypothetical protein
VITSAVVTSSLPPTLLLLSDVETGRGVVLETVVEEEVVVLEEGELVEADSVELSVVVLITASFSSETDRSFNSSFTSPDFS